MVPGSWSQGSGRPSFVSGTEKGTWKHRRGEKSRGAIWEGRGSRMRSWCFRCWDVPEGCSQAVVGSSVVLRSSPCLHGMKLTQSLAVGVAGKPPPAAGALGDGPTEEEAMLRCGPWFLGIPCALLSLCSLLLSIPPALPGIRGLQGVRISGWQVGICSLGGFSATWSSPLPPSALPRPRLTSTSPWLGRARPRAFPWFVLSQRPWDRFRCVGPNGYSLKP